MVQQQQYKTIGRITPIKQIPKDIPKTPILTHVKYYGKQAGYLGVITFGATVLLLSLAETFNIMNGSNNNKAQENIYLKSSALVRQHETVNKILGGQLRTAYGSPGSRIRSLMFGNGGRRVQYWVGGAIGDGTVVADGDAFALESVVVYTDDEVIQVYTKSSSVKKSWFNWGAPRF
jgi:hypothetical protein